MPSSDKPKKTPKRRGRKAYKQEPQITDGPLRWPQGMMRTLPQDRIRGDFKLSSPVATKSPLELVKQTIHDVFKRINIHEAEVTYNFAADEQAVDMDYPHPEVAIWYRWKGQEKLSLACDRFNTAIANFRACLETLEGFHKATKHPYVHHDFHVALGAFGIVRVEKPKPVKAPSKAHLDFRADWQEVLEIRNDQMDLGTGLPKDLMLPGRQRLNLAHLYHPDKKETCPDEGDSWQVIQDAASYVAGCIELQAKLPDQQKEAKARAKAEAAKRKEAREAAKAAPKAEPAAEDESDESDDEAPEKTEPSTEDLASIEGASEDASDDDLDEGDTPTDDDDDYRQPASDVDAILFDSTDSEDSDEDDEEIRDEIENRRRLFLDREADSDDEDEDKEDGDAAVI